MSHPREVLLISSYHPEEISDYKWGKVYTEDVQSIITLTTDTTNILKDKAAFLWENALNVLGLRVSRKKAWEEEENFLYNTQEESKTVGDENPWGREGGAKIPSKVQDKGLV